MTALAPSATPSVVDALHGIAKTWTAWAVLLLFVGVELLNIAALPIALETIKAKTTIAQAVTADATAVVAKLRQQAEADAATEDARTKGEIARQAERYRQAEARKADNEAKARRELATNAPEVQAAETEIKKQTAVINDEKAKHEARRARAEAVKTAAEAQIADADAKLQTASQRAALIEQRKKGFMACYTARHLEYRSSHPNNVMGAGTPCSILANNYKACNARWMRQECLPTLH